MKHILLAAALAAALPLAAHAAAGGEGNNTGCQGQGNPNSPCVPTTNPPGTGGGSGGTTINNGGAGGTGGAARAASRSRATANATGGAATATVGPITVNSGGGGGSGGVVIQDRLQAPGIAIGAPPGGVCAVGISLGGSVVGGSGGLGISWEGEQCERRMKAHAAAQRGNVALAEEIMCGDREERAARLRLARAGRGQPCLADMPPAASEPPALPTSAAPVAAASSPIPAAPRRNRPAYCAASEARGVPLLNSECQG